MTRSEAREKAFLLVFELSFKKDESMSEIIELAVNECDFKLNTFATELAMGVFDRRYELDSIIETNASSWKLNRISKVSLAVLRLCIYELIHRSEIPKGASINEAVDLAKKYAGDEEGSFVNGVLGGIVKTDFFKDIIGENVDIELLKTQDIEEETTEESSEEKVDG